jgi:hypothetical protein
MCVILVCPENIRPDSATIAACHRANPHGVGVAWRDDGEVHWSKKLEPDELEPLITDITGEIVIHLLCPVLSCGFLRAGGQGGGSAAEESRTTQGIT